MIEEVKDKFLKSPMSELLPKIQRVADNVSPERKEELAALHKEHNFELDIVDRRGFAMYVDLESKVISMSIAALEYLWACSHHYWIVAQEYAQAQRQRQEKFDAHGNARLTNAALLVQRARNNLYSSDENWPTQLPKPTDSGEDIDVANELFLVALGFIFHHEIGHVVLCHQCNNTVMSIADEKKADSYAAHWILDGLEHDDPRLKKRALGMATAILCLQSLEVGRKCTNQSTHPAAYQRLYDCISPFKLDKAENIQAYSSLILQYLFYDEGVKADIDGANFTDILSDILVQIAKVR